MKLWIDAQLSPALAPWINESVQGMDAVSLKWLDLRDAEDLDVFMAARKAGAVIMTKDCDFIELLARHGPPPQGDLAYLRQHLEHGTPQYPPHQIIDGSRTPHRSRSSRRNPLIPQF